jgi:hypothetical protein
MFLLLSWKVGETPHLDNMTKDLVTWAKMLSNATKEGKSFQIYQVVGDELHLIWPEPATSLTFVANDPEPK